MEQVRLASSLVDDLRRADAVAGADLLCDVAIQAHTRLSAWAARASYSREVGDALQSALADLSIEAAWLAIDADRRSEARPYLNEAITRARIADDPRVEVRALTHLSLLIRESQPGESLHCAEAALRISAGWATPRLTTLLHLRRAPAYAVLGDVSGFSREMTKARRELDRGTHEDDQGFVHFVNAQELNGIEGLSYLALDRPERAVQSLRAITANPSPEPSAKPGLLHGATLGGGVPAGRRQRGGTYRSGRPAGGAPNQLEAGESASCAGAPESGGATAGNHDDPPVRRRLRPGGERVIRGFATSPSQCRRG